MTQGIQRRTTKGGVVSYRIQIRQSDGFPPKSKSFPTLQEAKDWQTQEKARRRQGAYFPEQSLHKRTMAELIDRYSAVILPDQLKDVRNKKRHLEWWRQKLGKYSVNIVTSDLISQYRQVLLKEITCKGTKRSPATINRYLAALSSVMSYAVNECGWLPANPCKRVLKLKESNGRDRVASGEECTKILEECRNSRNEHLLPIFLIALTTGMRRGEIIKLTWDCIDLERGLITLKDTKNGKPRTTSLVGESLQLLRERYLIRSQHSPYLFPAKKRFGHICIRKAWDEAMKRAHVQGLRFHDLRHTFATYAAESGASNLELATAMGHQTLQMLQRYTHMNATTTHRLSSAVHNKILESADGKDKTPKTR